MAKSNKNSRPAPKPKVVAQRTDVEPHLRTHEEREELFPRLEALSQRLYQTQTFVLAALLDSGLTIVPLDPSARETVPAPPAPVSAPQDNEEK